MKTTENQRIKILRKHLKLSQQMFAESIGLKQGTYSGIESGANPLSTRAKIIIQNLYNVNANWLESGIGDMILSAPEESYPTTTTRSHSHTTGRIARPNLPLTYYKMINDETKTDYLIPVFDRYSTGVLSPLLDPDSQGPAPIAILRKDLQTDCELVVQHKDKAMDNVLRPKCYLGIKRLHKFKETIIPGMICIVVLDEYTIERYVHADDSPNMLLLKSVDPELYPNMS